MVGISPSVQQNLEFDKKSAFLSITTSEELASFFNIDNKKLNFLLYKIRTKYIQFEIPKKSGGTRKILSPIPPLKNIQDKLKNVLDEIYNPSRVVHGYVDDKSIVSNAKKHAGRKYLLNVDLKDFFPSVNFGRIYGLFKAYPFKFPEKIAMQLAQICTYENQLPQGAPTSPVISNMICKRLDRDLEKLSKLLKVTYTRYADDLSFSWNEKETAEKILSAASSVVFDGPIKEVIEKNGFQINHQKVNARTHLERQIVTGIIVNNEKINLRRTFSRNIRAMLHAWAKFGYNAAQLEYLEKYRSKHRYSASSAPSFSQIVKGKLDYMRMVCGADHPTYKKLLANYNQLSDKINHETISHKIPDALWIVQNDDSFEQGTAFQLDGVGAVTCAHIFEGGGVVSAFKASAPDVRYPVIPISINKDADLAVIGIKADQNGIPLQADYSWQARIGSKMVVAGYPNYREGDQVFIDRGEVVQIRTLPKTVGTPWFVVNAKIVAGNSGGPILNRLNKVVGVAVTGSQGFEETDQDKSLKHGFVPIYLLQQKN